MADTPVSIIAYNTHLFLDTAPGFFGQEYQDELRLEGIAKRLIESRADIVGLSEVWSDSVKRKLADKVRLHYPFSFYHPTPWTTIGSGLLLLSRHLITEPKFTGFKDLVGWDALSEKGFYSAIVSVKQDNGRRIPYFVALTHTQSGSSGDETKARKSNLDQIWAGIANLPFRGYPLILMGDMNVIGEKNGIETSEYRMMENKFATFKMNDLGRFVYPDARKDPLFTYDYFSNNLARIFAPDDKVSERLDYVFATEAYTAKPEYTAFDVLTDWKYPDPKTRGYTDLSDHYGLKTTNHTAG